MRISFFVYNLQFTKLTFVCSDDISFLFVCMFVRSNMKKASKFVTGKFACLLIYLQTSYFPFLCYQFVQVMNELINNQQKKTPLIFLSMTHLLK